MRIGKITENALKRSVLKLLRTEYKDVKSAAVGSDCAFSANKEAFSTVSSVTADTKDPGFYAAAKALIGLFSQGITPDHVSVSIMLPVDAEEQMVKDIVRGAIAAAKMFDVPYTGGHTEVTKAVNKALVTAVAVAGRSDSPLISAKPLAGDDLVVTKWIALEGTSMLALEKKDELSSRYPVPFIEEAERFRALLDIRAEAAVAVKSGVRAIHDVSSGGIYASLWEMSEKAGCGLEVDLRKIPVRQETIEICEFFELNPYQLTSGGALLIATGDGKGLVKKLEEEGIPAAVIGALKEGNDKIIVNGDEKRFLESPQADEIHKVL
jgi:hydrogenase maturation factor